MVKGARVTNLEMTCRSLRDQINIMSLRLTDAYDRNRELQMEIEHLTKTTKKLYETAENDHTLAPRA